jgi:hypothetical protein
MKKSEIKKALLDKCMEMQNNIIDLAKKGIADAQESVNDQKGNTEEESDSFRETMQVTIDMHARQLDEGIKGLAILNRINPAITYKDIVLGSIVCTELQNYFISISLGEVIVDKKKFMTISTISPLYKAISEKKKGDTFELRDKKYKITDVF